MLLALAGDGQTPEHANRTSARLSRRSLLAGGIAALAAGFTLPRAHAAARARDEADTSSQSRDEAIRSLPLSNLTAETRRKLMGVIERPSIYRRLPYKSIDCDPALYVFLIRNPEIVISIWKLMGVQNMAAERRGPYLWKGNDGAGTECDVELVYGTDNLHVIYCDGLYEGSLLARKITGRSVLIINTGYSQAADRRWLVTNRLDLFLQIDNTAADVVARTLSPWVGKVADANFQESCYFASKLSQTAEQNGLGIQKLANRLEEVEPPVRDEFAKVAAAVQQRAALRDVGGTVQRR